MITLQNDFHSTHVRVRVRTEQDWGEGTITRNQYMTAARKLCGVEGCTCGVVRGGEYVVEAERWSPDDGRPTLYTIYRIEP